MSMLLKELGESDGYIHGKICRFIYRRSCQMAITTVLYTIATPLVFAGSEPAKAPAMQRGGTQDSEVRTVSSRPDMVSGGDVLVEMTTPNHSRWSAHLNGRNVSSSFHPTQGTEKLRALLTGLKLGENTLQIRVGGEIRSKLKIANHALTGPIFSGQHQEPFICQTVANGLGEATDRDCDAKTIVQYYYKSTAQVQGLDKEAFAESVSASVRANARGTIAPGFKMYNTSDPLPVDVAQVVTPDGRRVNYIVRREIGTINRAVYDMEFLHQPGQPLPSPWMPQTPGWNGRLIYVLGGGCGAGYHQGTFEGAIGPSQEPLLVQGYAVATSTLNVLGNNCNDKISAETLSMVKEHFIKEFGEPVHTIGFGGSGGAIQQELISQNYPGLLDGIIPSWSLPDVMNAVYLTTDCSLLDRAFSTSKHRWSEEQKTAVSGLATWHTCIAGGSSAKVGWINPQNCDPSIPKETIYDPATNPKGIRCDIFDNEINVLGRSPQTGFARRPLDNVGVQYGLVAFNGGKIDAEQFIDLNERIGGHDDDGNIVAARTQADTEGLRSAYQHGLVLIGGGALSQIPIIDYRPYTDDIADGHVRFRSFEARVRLIKANGTADNQSILVYPRLEFIQLASYLRNPEILDAEGERDLVPLMDRWLDNIEVDNAAGTVSAKVSRNKPAELSDGCIAIDGERIVEPTTYDGPGKCNQLYPPHGDPRLAAGAPLANDILKCALKPITPADYSQPVTVAQLERLKSVFITGVCDYGRPGVGQQVATTEWQRYN
jgi:hypothetical protein